MDAIPEKIEKIIKDIEENSLKLNFKYFFWNIITIREKLLLELYGLKKELFNHLILISKRKSKDTNIGKFKDLNDRLFSSPNSIYMENIIKQGLPPISDILPRLNKNLIILKKNNNKKWMKVINSIFDYIVILKKRNGVNINYQNINDINFCTIKKFASNGNLMEVFEPVINQINKDYQNKFNDYKEYKIKESLKYIFIMYLFHLALGYDIFIYYPIKLGQSFVVFTLIMKYENFCKKVKKFLNFLLGYLKIINNFVVYQFYIDLNQEILKHALRSAVAAIMARNMSHNIGSHVLNYLSNPDELDNLWII